MTVWVILCRNLPQILVNTIVTCTLKLPSSTWTTDTYVEIEIIGQCHITPNQLKSVLKISGTVLKLRQISCLSQGTYQVFNECS